MMIHTKKQAMVMIKETITLLENAQHNLNDIGNCWEILDIGDKERSYCKDYSHKIYTIIEHINKIK